MSVNAVERVAYRCPRSGNALYDSGTVLRTEDGKHEYPIRNGIPVFLAYPAPRTADVDRLDHMLQLSPLVTCVDALKQGYGADSPQLEYVTRAPAFLHFMPMTTSDTVLEIGPGVGQFTPHIARLVRRVHALEVIEQQARLTAARCAESGVTNVCVDCGGDDCRLPYADGRFDAVIMNLVFEWCASRNVDEAPVTGQSRLLREVARVLKPGGVLYLTTKNRFSLHYVLGRPDEHAFLLPFGNAMPRSLLRLVVWLTGRAARADTRSPWGRGYLYSHWGLRRVVRRAGFVDVDIFCPAPEPRSPERFIPANARAIAAARRDLEMPLADGRFTRPLMHLMPAALVKYFSYGQTVLARTPRG